MSAPRPIGVFGGTFDPVHNAHLRVALDALEQLGLAEVRFVPSARPPHRDRPDVSAEQRARLLDLATAGQPGFVVDRRELQRDGPSYMVDTLASLQRQFPATPLCLLLGQDAFHGLPGWYRWRELWHRAHLVVMRRAGYREPPPGELAALIDERRADPADPGVLVRQPAGLLLEIEVTPLELSATRLRELLAGGRSARFLTPDPVCRALQADNPYRTGAATAPP